MSAGIIEIRIHFSRILSITFYESFQPHYRIVKKMWLRKTIIG